MTDRAAGNRLHTTAYILHPPPGFSGDRFTWYVVDHTRRYIEMGHTVLARLEDQTLPPPTLTDLELILSSHKGIGPTLTKMFLVSIHLR